MYLHSNKVTVINSTVTKSCELVHVARLTRADTMAWDAGLMTVRSTLRDSGKPSDWFPGSGVRRQRGRAGMLGQQISVKSWAVNAGSLDFKPRESPRMAHQMLGGRSVRQEVGLIHGLV